MNVAKFKDRHDAGRKLATLLKSYTSSDAIVYALPRGGVIIAYEIALQLHLPLELVITRKIRHPESPEYAIGAISEHGKYSLSLEAEFIDTNMLDSEIEFQKREIKRRREVYNGKHKALNCKDRTVIIVDDGVATGFSLSAAIDDLRVQGPKEIVVAVPVIPQDIVMSIKLIVDRFYALHAIKKEFDSVGKYYENFDQLTDEEVIFFLSDIWNKKKNNP